MVSQAKIDLAVLLKLFQHAEANGEAEPPQEISNLFQVDIPIPRIVAALEELEGRGEVVRVHDRYHEDEGLWRIGRDGIRTVEKALRQPSSFIALLQVNGDHWLTSAEADAANLTKLKRYHPQDPAPISNNDDSATPNTPSPQPVIITNNFHSSNEAKVGHASSSKDRSGWWNFGAAIIIGAISIAVTLWVSGKL